MNTRPVGVDRDGNGIWEDTETGERYNTGEPLTLAERADAGLPLPDLTDFATYHVSFFVTVDRQQVSDPSDWDWHEIIGENGATMLSTQPVHVEQWDLDEITALDMDAYNKREVCDATEN